VEEFLMGNKAKLAGNPFSHTYKALLQVLQHNTERVSKKRGPDPVKAQPAKRRATQATARPLSSDSAHSGTSSESKDEEFSKNLLNAFISDVFDILEAKQQTKLTWPATSYYVELAVR
jgi:hypothetical protein